MIGRPLLGISILFTTVTFTSWPQQWATLCLTLWILVLALVLILPLKKHRDVWVLPVLKGFTFKIFFFFFFATAEFFGVHCLYCMVLCDAEGWLDSRQTFVNGNFQILLQIYQWCAKSSVFYKIFQGFCHFQIKDQVGMPQFMYSL